jgi:formylglycine-generating enzyme required for sulfatase activity
MTQLKRVSIFVLIFSSGVLVCSQKETPQLHPTEPQMVFVEGGTFTMGCSNGSECYPEELPQHQVTLSSFNIGKYLVTQKQWVAIMDTNPSFHRGDDLPVEQVSWLEVQVFIAKLNEATGKNYRLATETEWEYAARGGKNSKGYKYSGSNDIDEIAWYILNSEDKTHPVGTKKPNELGIYDMTGNLWEWCNDWYGAYPKELQINQIHSPFAKAQIDPQGPDTGSQRVIRGGRWGCPTRFSRVSYRRSTDPEAFGKGIGFRLAHP